MSTVADDLGTPHLRFERRGPIGWCIIDRPEVRNALTSRMYFGIRRAIDLVNEDDALHALVITGTGDVFSSGGDLRREVHAADAASSDYRMGELIGIDALPFKSIRQSPAPVVSAVNGICQGGGLTIALLSDIVVASDQATFRAPELLVGVVDSWLAQVMLAHAGAALTRDLMFTGRRLSAEDALRHGLISRVVAHDDLAPAAQQAACEIVRSAPQAREQLKRIINGSYGLIDEISFGSSVRGPEALEGAAAFVQKRSPGWVPEAVREELRGLTPGTYRA